MKIFDRGETIIIMLPHSLSVFSLFSSCMAKKTSSKKMNFVPLGDRVLLKPLVADDQKTSSGIIIPDTVSKEKPEQGTVVAVGPGKVHDDGTRTPLSVKKGDRVMFSKYSPDEITIDGDKYLVVSESSIIGIIS